MAGVFKSLDKSDIRITPFRAYKQWSDNITYCDYSPSLPPVTSPLHATFATTNRLLIANSTSASLLDYTSEDLPSVSQYTYGFPPSTGLVSVDSLGTSVFALTTTALTLISNGSTTSSFTSHTNARFRDVTYGSGSDAYIAVSDFSSGAGWIYRYNSSGVEQSKVTSTYALKKVNGETAINNHDSNYWALGTDFIGTSLLAFNKTTLALTQQIPLSGLTNVKQLIYSTVNRGYYCLIGSDLYFVSIDTFIATLIQQNIAVILQEENQSTHIHTISNTGTIYIDINSNGQSLTYTQVDANNHIGYNTVKSMVINSKRVLGILAGNVFITYDIIRDTLSNPKHLDGSTNLVGLVSNQTITTSIFGYGPNKLVDLTCEPDDFTVYKGDYSTISSYTYSDPLEVSFEEGNIALTRQEPLTADNKYQRIVHRSIDHLFYRDYVTNNKATFGGGNINYQRRELNDIVKVLSLPQRKYGEEIQQGSVIVDVFRETTGLTYTLVDDLYGNLLITGSIPGTQVTSSNVVGRWHFNNGYKYYGKGPVGFEQEVSDGYWPMRATYNNIVFGSMSTTPDYLGASAYFSVNNTSSLIISPSVFAKYKQTYNFENSDFSIFFTIKPEYPTVNYEFANIITKEGPVEDIFIDINGNIGSTPAGTNFPYKIKLCVSGSNQGKLYFERSSGFQTTQVISSIALAASTKYNVAVTKTGATMEIFIDGNQRGSTIDTTSTGTYQSKLCSNASNIYVGADYSSGSMFNGYLDNLKMYNVALKTDDLTYLQSTNGIGDRFVGNVFYKQGMIVITDPMANEIDILTASCRGTQTIYETEVSCTIGGGEFNHSSNPTLQEYEPISDEFVFRPFVSSSDFKPYITTIGLYNPTINQDAFTVLGSTMTIGQVQMNQGLIFDLTGGLVSFLLPNYILPNPTQGSTDPTLINFNPTQGSADPTLINFNPEQGSADPTLINFNPEQGTATLNTVSITNTNNLSLTKPKEFHGEANLNILQYELDRVLAKTLPEVKHGSTDGISTLTRSTSEESSNYRPEYEPVDQPDLTSLSSENTEKRFISKGIEPSRNFVPQYEIPTESGVDLNNYINLANSRSRGYEEWKANLPKSATDTPASHSMALIRKSKDENSDTTNDYVTLSFTSVRDGNTIAFKSYITTLSDNWSPTYTDIKYVGRQDTLKVFNGVTRNISLGFKIPSDSDNSHRLMYSKLQSLIRASVIGDYQNGKPYIVGPMMKITVGNYVRNTPCVVNSLKIDTNPSEYTW